METESVWDYPRPPRLDPVAQMIRIAFAGVLIAETREAMRVLETSHPPVYYLPRGCFSCEIAASKRQSLCEWKGLADYLTLRSGGREAMDCAWTYPNPKAEFAAIAGHIAVYPAAMDSCTVDGEKVHPQPGGFYGGWITHNLIAPFKGSPGTMNW